MQKDQIFDLLIEIKQNYPNVDVSDDAVDRHYEHLQDIPFEIAIQNVRDHVRGSVYPPKIAEIRGGWTDYGARMKQNTADIFAEQERNRKQAVPMPDTVRAQLNKIWGRNQA